MNNEILMLMEEVKNLKRKLDNKIEELSAAMQQSKPQGVMLSSEIIRMYEETGELRITNSIHGDNL